MNLLSQEKVKSFAAFSKKNVVMLVALFAAVVTSFIVPVDSTYLGYFDLKTLTCLFCVLAVVCALKISTSFICWPEKSCSSSKTPGCVY